MNIGKFLAGDKAKTFKPKKSHRVGTKRYDLHKHAQATPGARASPAASTPRRPSP